MRTYRLAGQYRLPEVGAVWVHAQPCRQRVRNLHVLCWPKVVPGDLGKEDAVTEYRVIEQCRVRTKSLPTLGAYIDVSSGGRMPVAPAT